MVGVLTVFGLGLNCHLVQSLHLCLAAFAPLAAEAFKLTTSWNAEEDWWRWNRRHTQLVNRSTHFFSCARLHIHLHIHFDYSKPESRADLAHLKVDKGESKYCPLGPLLVHTHMLAQLAQRSAPQHALLEGWLIHSPILLCSVQVGDLALLNPRGGWGWHRPGFIATFARSSPSLDNLSGHVAGF